MLNDRMCGAWRTDRREIFYRYKLHAKRRESVDPFQNQGAWCIVGAKAEMAGMWRIACACTEQKISTKSNQELTLALLCESWRLKLPAKTTLA